jgi:hypothetical protein
MAERMSAMGFLLSEALWTKVFRADPHHSTKLSTVPSAVMQAETHWYGFHVPADSGRTLTFISFHVGCEFTHAIDHWRDSD